MDNPVEAPIEQELTAYAEANGIDVAVDLADVFEGLGWVPSGAYNSEQLTKYVLCAFADKVAGHGGPCIVDLPELAGQIHVGVPDLIEAIAAINATLTLAAITPIHGFGNNISLPWSPRACEGVGQFLVDEENVPAELAMIPEELIHTPVYVDEDLAQHVVKIVEESGPAALLASDLWDLPYCAQVQIAVTFAELDLDPEVDVVGEGHVAGHGHVIVARASGDPRPCSEQARAALLAALPTPTSTDQLLTAAAGAAVANIVAPKPAPTSPTPRLEALTELVIEMAASGFSEAQLLYDADFSGELTATDLDGLTNANWIISFLAGNTSEKLGALNAAQKAFASTLVDATLQHLMTDEALIAEGFTRQDAASMLQAPLEQKLRLLYGPQKAR